MLTLLKNLSTIVTVDAKAKKYLAGKDMQQLSVIKNASIIFDDKIRWIGTNEDLRHVFADELFKPDRIIDGTGKTALPGFVDSHTHFVFAGNRSTEFGRRLAGVSYQEIAAEGGGILTTMKATRKASVEQLFEQGRKLLLSAVRYGSTAFEIKSGYGLTLESELKQLRAIKLLKEEYPFHISATFLGAHDFPPEYKDDKQKYIDIICNEMIPAVAEEKLADYCDAFIDKGYYTLKQGEQILQTALEHGLKLKVHCDELADFGSAELAAKMGAVSADHLLFVSDKGIEAMKQSGTVASLLPGTAYFIRMPYAPARKIIESGVVTALATDCNPGSCFTENMQLIMNFAAINMNMTAEECIAAATINGAAAIEQSHKMGSLEKGKDADFILLNSENYTDLFYHFGINHVKEVWINGIKFCS